ncbi:membrane integrity-associated transporter subunit PqiC [bacterium]|nr:membrane integrity-associated transporter subunit PqiC [bacterium]
MIIKHITKILLLSVPLLFCGCGSLIKQPAPVISYYQLNYTPEISSNALIDKTILIRPFYISETFNRDSIMYSSEEFKCNYYPYKQWISAPQNQMTELFRSNFMKSGIFKAVIIPGQLQSPDLLLSSALTEIQENTKGEKSFGTVKINVTLSKPAFKTIPQQIIFQKSYKESVECEINNTDSLVKALSEATKRISAKAIKDVTDVARNP